MAHAAFVSAAVTPARVSLAELTTRDIESMTWLATALAPEWSLAGFESAVSAGDGVGIRDMQGVAIGAAAVLRDVPEAGDATVAFLAIDPERRFRGLGGEAGLALDAKLRSEGVSKVYAPVPEGRGLAVYFWLRLGFRPLTTPESPGDLIGLSAEPIKGIWMLRDQA